MKGGNALDTPRWRDLYLCVAARGVSVCGDLLAATALALVLTQRGAGGFVVGALLLGAAMPPVLLAPVAGRIADRVDSRLAVAATAPLQALCCLAMLTTSSPAALIALNTALAVGVAFTQPVLAALVPEMVGVENVPRANAVMQTATSLGMLAGPLAAGLVVGASGLRVPLVLDAGSFVGIAVAGLAIRTRRNQGRRPRLRDWRAASVSRGSDRTPDAALLRGDRPLATALLITGVVVAAVNLTDIAIVFFVRRTLGASATAYGLVMSGWMAGLTPGSWLAARRPAGDRGLFSCLAGGLLLMATAVLATGAAPGAAWVVPAFVVGGVGNGLAGSALGTLVARRTPPAVRGRAFATLGAVMNAAMATGYVLSSLLLAVVAPRAVILGSGAVALAGAGAMISVLRHAKGAPGATLAGRPERA